MATEYRAWEVLTFARDQIEAVMIESFLDSEGIESRRPNSRGLSYDAGIGPGVAGELGIRIEVPQNLHLRAVQLLKEQRERVASGEGTLQEEAPTLDRAGVEAVIGSHQMPRPEPHWRGSRWQKGLLGAGVLTVVLGVGVGLKEAFAETSRGRAGVALALCLSGATVVAIGARGGHD